MRTRKKDLKPRFIKKKAGYKPVTAGIAKTSLHKVKKTLPKVDLYRDEIPLLVSDWCIKCDVSVSPTAYLRDIVKKSAHDLMSIMAEYPASEWHARRKDIQNNFLKHSVKGQVEAIAEINDQHMKAAKLGLAKALEMLTKLKIEHYTDKRGVIQLRRFKSTDLKHCVDSIAVAQKVMRTALGLPSDEGAIQIWQQLNLNPGDGSSKEIPEDTDLALEAASSTFSYDEIKALIKLRLEADEKGLKSMKDMVIDVEYTSVG